MDSNVSKETPGLPGNPNIGAYVIEGEAVLIDSGNDSLRRKILRLAEETGWNIRLIINTHFHADHVGGNAFIQKRTGCDRLAKETPFTDMPEMEPEILWSGRAAEDPQCFSRRPIKRTITATPGTVIE